jgi:hypothetical protein
MNKTIAFYLRGVKDLSFWICFKKKGCLPVPALIIDQGIVAQPPE